VRFELRVKNWRSYLPIWDTIANYRRDDFSHDLVSGFILGIITVPQAIAYAYLAGLPPQAGLYACLLPMFFYAILGSSKHLIVGPVAVAALMVASAISEFAPAYSDAYLGITTILCLQVGIFLWLLRLTQMGGVVNLLSHAVIKGFVNAAVVLIIISQLNAFTGVAPTVPASAGPIEHIIDLAGNIGEFNSATLAVAFASLIGLYVVQRTAVPIARLIFPWLANNHPIRNSGAMVMAILAAITVWVLNLDLGWGVATVGYVPAGMPELTIPPFDLELWINLAPTAAMVAFVAYVESYSVGTTLATRDRTRINSHQELIALGAANIGAAFTGAYPIAGSFSRSSVNYQTGARTQVSGLICIAVIVLMLLYFTPAFERLPHATLAAIIIVSVIGLFDFGHLREHFAFYKEDTITQMATMGLVLLFGVETGLLGGVALSIAFFIRESSRPHITMVGRIAGTEQFRGQKRFDVETFDHIATVRVDENLYFANANQVENKLLKLIERRNGTRHLVLVCSAVNTIDITGLEMLYRVNESLKRHDVLFHFCDVKSAVMRQLDVTDFRERMSGQIFFNADQATRELAATID
jgi:SulP family sulfate permease